jgi:hypothetical protein
MMTPFLRADGAGPRSTTRTVTERRFWMLVTRTTVPNGYVGCAAINASLSKRVPLAVVLPSNILA